MPPFVSRKREHSLQPSPRPAKAKKPAAKDKKPTLFDAADAPSSKSKSGKEAQEYLDSRDDDDDDELSDVDSDEFGDVQPAKKQKTSHPAPQDDDDEDEMDWEDAIAEGSSKIPAPAQDDSEIGDISISLNDDGTYVEPLVSLATGKKGPSKRERQIRVLTHCLHVQTLLWHNTVRNSWLNDKEVHKTLLDGLTEGVKKEITGWKDAMGTLSKEELEAKKKEAAKKNKRGRKGKEKSSGRDWNYDAQHTEQGVPNLSGGDPLLRLLKVLTAYWRKRFTVTAPAIRKQGYMPLKRLREEIKAWEKNKNDAEDHGERIEDREAFRELAKKCEGSRDVGGQLFVALLRAIGLETRMVANLQPAGLGWSKAEEANPKKSKKDPKVEAPAEESEADEAKPAPSTKKKAPYKLKEEKPKRKSSRGQQGRPINLDESGSSLSEPPSSDSFPEDPAGNDDDDDLSVIDVTPATPKKPTKKYDRDLAFPTYWAEVCSPVSHKFIPVDPIVLSTIASNDELLQTFEPRGKKSENAKQVICYTTAFSADGTAKDVTVRYLKKHQLPGKTKGMRMPAEKIPIYNKRGKVKKYQEYDWFRTVMLLYERPESKCTAADDLEEQTDLKPFKPGKEDKEVEKESLQWYKQSADFVLEQHLRREEAIKPGSKQVKTFTAGKGDKAKEHLVYRRDDVVTCKTVESWHKEGRMIKTGEQPMKHVPMRAVTLVRKREMEDALRETGEKLQQGLYSWDQTDWIIPPPIENGVIPKNAFGNMDVYVETMVPKGAVHLPLKGTAKICRKLEIDYAEACTGFEFGKQRAVPVLTGVVVAEENAQMVRDAWRAEQAEIKRKEDTKRTDTALHWWRKMLMGLRIIDRMRTEYANAGGAEEEINPFVKKAKDEGREVDMSEDVGDAGAGGFFRPGYDEEEVPQGRAFDRADDDFAGGFMAEDEDEDQDMNHIDEAGDGGFLVEEDAESLQPPEASNTGNHATITPISLQSLHKTPDRDEEDDSDDKPVVPKVKTSKTKAVGSNKKTSTKSSARSKAKPVAPADETDESSLSDLDEDDSSEPSGKRNSPKVIITPQPKRASSGRAARSNRSAVKKATPVRSQYFTAADDDGEEEEESSEQEVVKPTRTTARTRNTKK